MTENECRLAFALNCCTFCPGINTKRFARNMATLAEHSPDTELTPKQREYLRTAVIRFARQIDADVVALAFMPDMLRGIQPDALTQQHDEAERATEPPQAPLFPDTPA